LGEIPQELVDEDQETILRLSEENVSLVSFFVSFFLSEKEERKKERKIKK